ncbi:MAG: insulinase family protein, partial [Robiginitomaculum sp.]|nr:insulinase family protein [Robiginitomaculum sp.]
LKNAKKNAGTTATNVFTRVLFGKDNSFAQPNAGTIATVSKLTVADAKAFYDNAYGPVGSNIQVVSNLPRNEIVRKLGVFGDWKGGNTDVPALKGFPELKAGTLYFIDKPDAAQSEIRIGKQGLNYDATGEFFRNELMNYNLGGAFNSRINLNLREDKGYTYGARSFFYGNDFRGAFRAQAAVRANTTVDSIRQFVKEIGNFQKDGMTAKELDFMKNSLGQRDARAYETPRQKLSYLSEIANYDLKPDFVTKQNNILQKVTLGELNALATKHLKLDEMIMVVVGDKGTVMEDLKELGYPIVELDADGNVVGG